MSGLGRDGTRDWQALLSVVVACAVAVQSLLIAVAGFSVLADVDRNTPGFELCLHDTSGAPELPSDKPDLSGYSHCIFCIAAAHDALIGTAPALFRRVKFAMMVIPWFGDTSGLRRLTRYTIASPRGPPFSA
jgi:hypothetical protein